MEVSLRTFQPVWYSTDAGYRAGTVQVTTTNGYVTLLDETDKKEVRVVASSVFPRNVEEGGPTAHLTSLVYLVWNSI